MVRARDRPVPLSMSTHGKLVVLLAMLMVITLMLACGDFNPESPMLDGVEHTVQEASR